MFEVPWKINGWNLQITHEKNGTWRSEPKLHDYVPAVNLQGCRSIFVCWWGGVSSSSRDLFLEVLTLGIAGKKKKETHVWWSQEIVSIHRYLYSLSSMDSFPDVGGGVAMTQRPFIRPHSGGDGVPDARPTSLQHPLPAVLGLEKLGGYSGVHRSKDLNFKPSPQHSGGWTGPPLKIISEMIVG